MSPQERTDIRGVTFPIIWSVVIGAAGMCCTVVGAAVHIEKAFAEQSGRVKSLEDWRHDVAPKIDATATDMAIVKNKLNIK